MEVVDDLFSQVSLRDEVVVEDGVGDGEEEEEEYDEFIHCGIL